ncbi:hypothetical protein BD408DRAFT_416125 [Parasitella parasitica]|nr:hypothetical protein BD408DRAFT_416125 [Parasitella parasitica]
MLSNSHSSPDVQDSQQPMTMQPALSVYYAQEYGLKQSPAYSLIEPTNNMTFVPPISSSRNHHNLLYSSSNATANSSAATTTANATPIVSSHCAGSPSLSPSSSSTSANSSPVHPVYHETTSDNKYIQRQQASNTSLPTSTGAPTNALSLLSHHQSLF